MNTTTLTGYEIDVEDVEYVRHGDKPLLARIYKPRGKVELHLFEGVGEAFVTNDPTSPQSLEAIEKIIEFVHREMR